jgi:hypothetical protein
VLFALRWGRLDAYSLAEHRRISTWPLAADVRGLDVHYGVAVVHSDHAVTALDLRSGRRAEVGRTGTKIVDAQIEAAGVAYAFNRGSGGIARFVPIAAVERALGNT